ncbi:hypothetical protein MJ_0390 [Methanocaldococcus jannaschii DSM 2661]|uniref:Uncharacterized protein MJ0390 n=1 Tax=Methanocaldococcus jannaschii (strain ATCC 43067 / DSM 2661 / JAL-1 / JCM 10045 / NBRC 100440) TaxID=243232 RepID=Y390_METJA|nr:hypothetical protein [Methanocaldococcus jannaschii]Q57835.1 RecName: Full=Uncharacterized protein MJ0390 [Methanocaldococcus jannaschii DSM 2661]AAB98381.1 hypothetical protein MJ_0390 [Methanocaldococcus jannaschii DSM 2661]
MEEKIILSIQNPEDVLISYVDIYLGDKNVSLEVLSKDTAKINLPFDKDEGEGEIVVKIKYKTLPHYKNNNNKKEVKKQDYKNLTQTLNEITKKTTNRKDNDIIIADSKPVSLDGLKKEEKKKKLNDIIIV